MRKPKSSKKRYKKWHSKTLSDAHKKFDLRLKYQKKIGKQKFKYYEKKYMKKNQIDEIVNEDPSDYISPSIYTNPHELNNNNNSTNYEYLKNYAKHKFCEVLKCKEDEIRVFDLDIELSLKSNRNNVQLLNIFGVDYGVPFIKNMGVKAKDFGDGLIFYNIIDKDSNVKITYAVYSIKISGYGIYLLLTKKGEAFKVLLNARRNIPKKNPILPVLEESVINDILDNTIGFIKNRRILKKYNVGLNRGIVLSGPPGNGKTMICRYIKDLAANRNIYIQEISNSSLMDAYAKDELNDIFTGFDPKGTITFFDDIDIGCLTRKEGSSDPKVACAILSAMDGMGDKSFPSVRIFSTNEEVKDLDKAFLRPGRIDKVFKFKKPTEDLRKRLIEQWDPDFKKMVNIEDLIEKTDDMSFAEISAIKTFLLHNMLDKRETNIDKIIDEIKNEVKEEAKYKKLGFQLEE